MKEPDIFIANEYASVIISIICAVKYFLWYDAFIQIAGIYGIEALLVIDK